MIEYGVAGRPLAGEPISGDMHLVSVFTGGVMVGLVDGLGHGAEAATAAQAAVDTVAAFSHEPLTSLFERCHRALLGTRGVVMSLASLTIPAAILTWVGVGNVEGLLMRADPSAVPARVSIPLRGGVVGYRLPELRAATIPLSPGDLLVLASDGISPDFDVGRERHRHPQHVAEGILARAAKPEDDALVLAVRWTGATA